MPQMTQIGSNAANTDTAKTTAQVASTQAAFRMLLPISDHSPVNGCDQRKKRYERYTNVDDDVIKDHLGQQG